MDASNLKEFNSRMQILTAIKKGSLFGGDVWQTLPGVNGRHLCQVVEIAYDAKADRIILTTSAVVPLDHTRAIYVRLNYRNIIFCLNPGEFDIQGENLICRHPYEARGLEERSGGDRFVLPFQADFSLSLKRMERTIREITYDIELRIIDVSEKGFGILISSHNREYFRSGDHFWLKAVDHSPLRNPILGQVCYVAPRGYYLKKGDVRVGLSLSLPLPKETLEGLKKKCSMVLSA